MNNSASMQLLNPMTARPDLAAENTVERRADNLTIHSAQQERLAKAAVAQEQAAVAASAVAATEALNAANAAAPKDFAAPLHPTVCADVVALAEIKRASANSYVHASNSGMHAGSYTDKHASNDKHTSSTAAARSGATDASDVAIATTSSHDKTSASEDGAVVSPRYRRLVMLAGVASVSTAILLIVIKFIVWMFSGSTTILASLTDSLLDLGASFVNLLALRFALAPADKTHRFGHFKAESLASLTQAAFIGGSALLLIVHGYERLMSPVTIAYVDIAIYVSIASIVITLFLTFFQGYVCKITKSEAIAADRFHYISDVGLNLSVIVALVLAQMGYLWADGLITMFLGGYIMISAFHIGQSAINTLLDHSLSVFDNNAIIKAIMQVKGIKSFHDLRTRQAGPQYYIQCHIVIKHDLPLDQAHMLSEQAEDNIRKLFPDADISLHMEPDVAATYEDITFKDELLVEDKASARAVDDKARAVSAPAAIPSAEAVTTGAGPMESLHSALNQHSAT